MADSLPEFSVPKPAQSAVLAMRDGAEIRLRRYGKPGGTRLALSHGNGFAINAYAPFWLPLAGDFDLVVFDVRNHGENTLHTAQGHVAANIYADFEDIFQGIQKNFGEVPTVGVFHSLSAISAIQHTLACGPRWAALALFDPPICPPEGNSLRVEHFTDMTVLAERTRRRRQSYPRAEDFAVQLRKLPQFSRMVPEGPMLLARHTLRENASGGWDLRHPRELEADTFISQDDPAMWARMGTLPVPAILIGGDPAVSDTPAAKICAAIHLDTGVEYAAIPNTTHFLQIENPQACRAALLAFLRRHNLLTRQTAA